MIVLCASTFSQSAVLADGVMLSTRVFDVLMDLSAVVVTVLFRSSEPVVFGFAFVAPLVCVFDWVSCHVL